MERIFMIGELGTLIYYKGKGLYCVLRKHDGVGVNRRVRGSIIVGIGGEEAGRIKRVNLGLGKEKYLRIPSLILRRRKKNKL